MQKCNPFSGMLEGTEIKGNAEAWARGTVTKTWARSGTQRSAAGCRVRLEGEGGNETTAGFPACCLLTLPVCTTLSFPFFCSPSINSCYILTNRSSF